MKIGDEVYIHGYIDEIRKDTVIIMNDGGYFGTVPEEIVEQPERPVGKWARQETDLMYWYECSECGAKPLYDEYRTGRVFSNYCPNCGSYNGGTP